ncbi:hypothetical protein [Pontibacter vulgaris]|uniref:hypothetical protein n=1 Tax=Pontibacter vulgaris TaxID=2905679 RepID=UPI001FA6CF0F|nr:hypothetical protein [Pontibacter vulgaris]
MISIIISILIQLAVLNGGTTANSTQNKGKDKPATSTSDNSMQTFGGTGNWLNPDAATSEQP